LEEHQATCDLEIAANTKHGRHRVLAARLTSFRADLVLPRSLGGSATRGATTPSPPKGMCAALVFEFASGGRKPLPQRRLQPGETPRFRGFLVHSSDVSHIRPENLPPSAHDFSEKSLELVSRRAYYFS
jgi:hypothetical protein